MKDKEELRKELEELSPFLSRMKKRADGFNVPENYFQSLPDEILKQVKPARASRSSSLRARLQPLWQPKYALAFAASVALLVAAVAFFRSKEANDPAQPYTSLSLQGISDEALQAYIFENIEEFDNELILKTHYSGQNGQPMPALSPESDPDELERYLDGIIDEIEVDELEDLL